ncbi:MAG: hypothetical protein RBR53_11205 [Desulforegulaceae bacterium]|nr:hypothetical protein [Desulforegulaceae bacterium]
MSICKNMVDFNVSISDQEKALHYKIMAHYNDKDISGKADIFLKKLIHYKSQKCQKCCSVYKDCIHHSMKNEDIIGHLKFFYPNGYDFKQENMRHGVGQITLDHIIEDLLKINGKMIYVFSTTKFMENFLKKHDFEHSSQFEFQYYLYLQ